tara:strand:+ start:661 stop:1098 length:438 start_codon:yes stop_codon:yes gene_type:complete
MATKEINHQNAVVLALKRDNAELTKKNQELMKKYAVKTSDPVVNDVIERIFIRHQQGMEKFKKTMSENSKTIPEWIEEVIEEQIDSISYLSTLKDRIVQREEELLKKLDMSKDNEQITQLKLDQAEKTIERLKLCKCPDVKKEKK